MFYVRKEKNWEINWKHLNKGIFFAKIITFRKISVTCLFLSLIFIDLNQQYYIIDKETHVSIIKVYLCCWTCFWEREKNKMLYFCLLLCYYEWCSAFNSHFKSFEICFNRFSLWTHCVLSVWVGAKKWKFYEFCGH